MELENVDAGKWKSDDLLELAQQFSELKPICRSNKVGRQTYHKFVAICGWYQIIVGDRDLVLSVRQIARLLAYADEAVPNLFKYALKDTTLRQVGTRPARYRFNIEKYSTLRERGGWMN
jgi:hypothetical protein